MDVTADLLTAELNNFYGLLQTAAGAFDIYGSDLKSWKAAVLDTAEAVGVKVDVWNFELPE
jgi:hypothetical protein